MKTLPACDPGGFVAPKPSIVALVNLRATHQGRRQFYIKGGQWVGASPMKGNRTQWNRRIPVSEVDSFAYIADSAIFQSL